MAVRSKPSADVASVAIYTAVRKSRQVRGAHACQMEDKVMEKSGAIVVLYHTSFDHLQLHNSERTRRLLYSFLLSTEHLLKQSLAHPALRHGHRAHWLPLDVIELVQLAQRLERVLADDAAKAYVVAIHERAVSPRRDEEF